METIWKGVMPAVTTKFTADDLLDIKMFTHNIQAQLNARCVRSSARRYFR